MTLGRVVVVGGGPAGASSAWQLARAGAEVTVLERSHHPRQKACAEYLSPEASRLLHDMDVLHAVESAGAARLRGMVVRAPSGDLIDGEFASAHGFRGFRDRGLAIRRTRLDPLLLGRAREAGAAVVEGARVTQLRRDARGVTTGVEALVDGERRWFDADLVIGADGLRSVVARRLGLARHGRWPRRLAIVAHFTGVHGIGDSGEMHVERDGYCGLADVGGGESNLSLVVPAHRAPEIAGDPAGFLLRWVAERPQLAPRYADAVLSGPVLTTGPFSAQTRRPWAPGVALVGDAAGYFDPFTGEGIHSALRGSEVLAPFALRVLEALSSGGRERRSGRRAAARALRGYARARWRTFGGTWTVEHIIAAVVAQPWLMNRAAAALSRRKDLADLLVGVTGDVVPARAVLRPGYLFSVFLRPLPRRRPDGEPDLPRLPA